MLIPLWLRDKLDGVTIIDSKGLDFVQYTIDDKVIVVANGSIKQEGKKEDILPKLLAADSCKILKNKM